MVGLISYLISNYRFSISNHDVVDKVHNDIIQVR